MNRDVQRLTHQIPQCDIDGAQHLGGHTPSADDLGFPHGIPLTPVRKRIFSDQCLLVMFHEGGDYFAWPPGGSAASPADPGNSLVRVFFHQIKACYGIGIFAIADRFWLGPGIALYCYVGYFQIAPC